MSTPPQTLDLPPLARAAHASHCNRCLSGLPNSQVDTDASRLAVGFYCIGSLDILGLLEEKTTVTDRESWREWIWEQQTNGRYGSGFRPGPYMSTSERPNENYTNYDTPHIIMTYTALLSLAILRDDFSRLNRSGLVSFIRACQRDDGSFSTVPGSNESDLRTFYCAFAISFMLNDWSGVDIPRAIAFVSSCRTYEGGYGQAPFCEAQGGTTYTAIASLYLAPRISQSSPLTLAERQATIRWLLQNQDKSGGFCGRTNKDADACYCFWCGASLQILGAKEYVNTIGMAKFLAKCQFKYGGIAKAPGEHPDPYHTYLSLAALSMYSPGSNSTHPNFASWKFEPLDPLLNSKQATAEWAMTYIPVRRAQVPSC